MKRIYSNNLALFQTETNIDIDLYQTMSCGCVFLDMNREMMAKNGTVHISQMFPFSKPKVIPKIHESRFPSSNCIFYIEFG